MIIFETRIISQTLIEIILTLYYLTKILKKWQ